MEAIPKTEMSVSFDELKFVLPEARLKPDELAWPYILHMMSLVEMGKVDFIEDDFKLHDVISLLPAPGHTPGHLFVDISQGRL